MFFRSGQGNGWIHLKSYESINRASLDRLPDRSDLFRLCPRNWFYSMPPASSLNATIFTGGLMNTSNQIEWIDYLIMIIYFVFVLGIGFVLKRFMRSSSEFLSAARAIPAWVAGLAFLSANLGAQEVI